MNLDHSFVQVSRCPATECEWDINFFLNLETLVQFDGSRFIVQRPTKTPKAKPQPQPEVPADIESTPRQRDSQPSGNRVIIDMDEEDSDVAPFETPRVLKKTKKRVEPVASETEDEEKNKVKSVEKKTTKGQNNKRANTVSCLCYYHHDLVIDERLLIMITIPFIATISRRRSGCQCQWNGNS